MISWGTNYDHLGEYQHLNDEYCKICNRDARFNYKVEQAYFRLFGLSLGPTKKSYYKICPHCSAKLKVRSDDPVLPYVKDAVPGRVKLKYIWGWIILIPIIAGLAYLYYEVSKI